MAEQKVPCGYRLMPSEKCVSCYVFHARTPFENRRLLELSPAHAALEEIVQVGALYELLAKNWMPLVL